MRKLSVVLMAVILLGTALLCCSCTQNVKAPTVVAKVDGSAVVEYGNAEYECTINRLTDGVISITLNSPENISGLTFKQSDGKYTISYGTLICRNENALFSEYSFPNLIMEILSAASNSENLIYQSSENELYTFSGSTSLGKFNITVDSEGKITDITQESLSLKVSFI